MWKVHDISGVVLGVTILATFLGPLGVQCADSDWETCKLAPERGAFCGDKYLLRWFFNDTAQRCERFWYGGCEGNNNNFADENECKEQCSSIDTRGTENIVIGEDDAKNNDNNRFVTTSDNRCRAQSDRGPGTTYTVQWFHNSTSSRCERFWYGGVGGNDNRFAEEDQCTAACINVQVDEDICSQPSMTGRCRARLFRWYYNKDRQECQEFVYGGCDGNKNNFRSQAECERECLSNTSGFGTSTDCRQNRYGCCPDGVTASQGNNYEGCPAACKSSRYGCCDDEETAAQGPSGEGCETIEISSGDGVACDQTDYGCCPDGITVATGPSNAGCDDAARNTDDSDIDIDVPATTTAPSLPVCEQAKEIGPCKAAIPRYFYNSRTGQCEVFQYGGCRGNQNNFETSAACEQQCRGRRLSAKEICAQSSDIGPCRSIQQKYAYNPQTKSCEQFTYGGCGGNRNNFDTETQCLQYCRETVPTVVVTPRPGRRQPVCEMSPALGPCTRSITKYHYNIATLQCEPFTYGGCLGNHNNFLSAEKCELYCGLRMGRSRTDDCRSPAEAGPCRGSIERWHYDARQGRCSLFNYGGCQGNTNNFGSEDECLSICRDERIVEPTRAPVTRPSPQQDEDICALPLVKTACEDDDHTHWYYDSGDGVCREVPDNDCNNNRNNFESRDQCEGYCSRSRVCRPLTYSSDVRCLAYMERFTYNENTDTCEMFVYGGCGGTANNFDTVDTCNRKCKRQVTVVTDAPDTSSPSEVCAMAEDSGNCLAYLRKWRYDSLTGECVEFTYGGCGGNRNNFETQRDCQSYCRREVVCQRYEEPEIGCFAYMPRWKYDPESQSCENFVYGGCGGNANNFQTIDACEDKCLKDDEVERTTVRVDNRVSSWRDICRLQADVGPCKNYIRKWHYNSLSQECEEFTYGGCLGNHNNFESRVQCMTYCDDERRRGEVTTLEPDMTTEGSGEISTTEMATGVDACILEIEAGDCRGYFPKWAYDNLNGECKQFVYGGCGGNGNNYDSQEQCERQCGPREVCVLPQRAGNCLAYMPRFFFDYDSQDCKEFVFGGCDGNANNFETREACLRRCDSLIRDRPTVGPSVKSGYCPPRTDWGGLLGACAPTCSQDQDCASNLKCCHHGCGFKCVNSVSEEPYQMSTLNRASAYSMSSDSILVRWYDPSLGGDQLIRDNRYYTVRYFSYDLGQYNYVNVTELSTQVRGLRSDTEYNFNVRVNDPPYLSEWSEDVKNRTHSGVVTKPGTCPYLSDDTVGICVEECQHDGDCESSEKCCSNGCGNVCVTPQGYNLCSLPKDPGTCADWEVRWFYNTDISRCDRFWYGGCNEGNDNNFMGEDECENQCVNPIVRPVTTPRPTEGPYDCRRSMWGCCLDRYTPKYDAEGTNCREYNPQPGGETVVPATPGETATLTCRYGGDIAWYREGKLVVSDGRREVGSDGTLTIYAANIEDDGMYACRVTTADGRQPQYHRYMLQVQVPIGILPGPDMISVKPGRQAFLHCEVYGNPKPEVSWHKGSQSLGSDSLYEMFSNGTLLIRRAQEEDIDSYTCTANNGVSPAVDRTIKLELREMLSARIENENGRVMEGGRIKLTCEGRGYPQPTITWEKSGRPLSTEGNVFISSDGQLTIREVTPSETGQYTCIVANGVEKIETSTSVQVVPKVIPDDKCVDRTSIMKCRLIVSAKLCGYVMYSKICCNSCMRFYNDEP